MVIPLLQMSTFKRRIEAFFMELFLTLVSGIAWMIVYEECIRLGFRDKSYAMPFFALGLNFAWELINCIGEITFQWHGATTGLTFVQTAVNGFWAALDIVILFTYFKFGRSEWKAQGLKESWFIPSPTRHRARSVLARCLLEALVTYGRAYRGCRNTNTRRSCHL